MEKLIISVFALLSILMAIYAKNLEPETKKDAVLFAICVSLGCIALLAVFIVTFNRRLFYLY